MGSIGWHDHMWMLQSTFCKIHLQIHFLENWCNLIQILRQFLPMSRINNKPTFVQIIIWHPAGDKPLFFLISRITYGDCIIPLITTYVNSMGHTTCNTSQDLRPNSHLSHGLVAVDLIHKLHNYRFDTLQCRDTFCVRNRICDGFACAMHSRHVPGHFLYKLRRICAFMNR